MIEGLTLEDALKIRNDVKDTLDAPSFNLAIRLALGIIEKARDRGHIEDWHVEDAVDDVEALLL